MDEKNGLWTYKDLCQRLSIKPGTAYSWVHQGRVPYIRFSKKMVRFDPAEIEVWLAEKEKKHLPLTSED